MEFASGLVKDETPLAAEGGYIDADNVRFRQGRPETRGGWELVSVTPFIGKARGAHEWSDLLGQPQAAWGTANNAYALSGGGILNITPPFSEGTILNPFTTVSGSPIVKVVITEHGLKAGQSITFANSAGVGGLSLNGTYPVTKVIDRNTITITAPSNATSTVATGAGGGVDFVAALPAGLEDGTGGAGYGTGTYGSGVYGLPSTLDFLPSVWSFANFGETLLANRRGGPLYLWQPATTYNDIITDNGFAGGTGWTLSTRGGTKVAGTAANLSQNILGAVKGGQVWRVTFAVALTAGTLTLQMNAGSPTPAVISVGLASTVISQSGTYSRLIVMPSNPSDIVFAADAAFAGTVTVTKLSLESKLTIIPEAPRRMGVMFVDPHRTVCAFDTYEADGDYNPLLARWSDLENYRIWVPDTNNFAGEIAVASGGRIVGALPSRGTNLIWTDAGLSAMAYSADGFAINAIASGCGLIGKNAVCEHNGVAYWWSNDGQRYRTTFDFQGTLPQLIDCRIQSEANRIAPSQEEKIFACINSKFSEVQWLYPNADYGTECNRALVYNFAENHWTSWSEARSSWIPGGIFPNPIGIGTDGYLYYQERGYTANGASLPNYLETAYFDIEDGGNLMLVSRFVPDYARQVGDITHQFFGKLWNNSSEVMTRTRTASVGTRKLDFRLKARQIKYRISSTGPWRAGAWRLEAEKAGAQR